MLIMSSKVTTDRNKKDKTFRKRIKNDSYVFAFNFYIEFH